MKSIIFNTDETRAILDNRKSAFRLPVQQITLASCAAFGSKTDFANDNEKQEFIEEFFLHNSRYKVGDIIYVRETWRKTGVQIEPYAYKATENLLHLLGEDNNIVTVKYRWKSPATMPREAARIFLRVTGVRCEKLQNALCGGMKAEGIIPATVTGGQWQQWQREYFKPVWNEKYAKKGYPWESNPWVWVIEFERTEKP